MSDDDLLEWSIGQGVTVEDFLDRFGGEIAKSYHARELPYETCDEIVNDLWGLLMQRTANGSSGAWPETFYRVYDAFDAGEYHRRADSSDDPIAQFTDPAIAEIVAALDGQSSVGAAVSANDC